ncbi:DUF4232 domain-containing protein [Streptomyces kanamyceticus]|uniref:DUF4232 domain-containing protein n=1 Tax=Streptomyces kanamyceticus TaxID=1967 RepID=A0A5J6GHB3_STRKN|nr:DUF4232 domain-containing protein [Streptomyces kanamyceticus]QEU93411.1 DUF4232 domain-containing protein [Streptomyces kanamyceticus]
MKITHASKTLLAGLALLSSLSLTACNGDDGTDAAGSGDSVPSASAGQDAGNGSDKGTGNGGSETGGSGGSTGKGTGGSDSGSGSGSGSDKGTVAGTGSNENGKVDICRSDELEVSAVDNTIGKEGTVTVAFKNGGGRDCAINGFAGVDLKTAAGDTIAGERNDDKPRADVLKDGETAAFNIDFPVNDSGGSGVRVSQILVTPPNETKTVTVAWPAGSLPAENPDSQALTGPIMLSPVGKVSDSPAG